MLAGAQSLDGLRRVKIDRSSDIDRIHRGIGESFVERGPGSNVVRLRLRRVARHQAIQAASGLGLNSGNDAADGDVANSNYDPVQHRQSELRCAEKFKGRPEPTFEINLKCKTTS